MYDLRGCIFFLKNYTQPLKNFKISGEKIINL